MALGMNARNVRRSLTVILACIITTILATDQQDCDCGYPRRLPRIVNGSEVSMHRFPWTVAVALRSGRYYMLRCGGTIISATYVLTAGHCVDAPSYLFGLITLTLAVDIGDHDLTTTSDSRNSIIDVVQSIRHPDFVRKTLKCDIGLLRLARPIVFRYNVRPVCLPSAELHIPAGRNVSVVGWGADSKGGEIGKVLKGISVPVISNEECQRLYLSRKVKILPNVICAGDLEGGHDACQGDSGGPCTLKCDSRVFQVGITSYGIGCATNQLPGVYTDVSQFLPWIKNNTHDDPACYQSCNFS